MTPSRWQLRGRALTPGSPPLVMGIVNVTPDSFSDGGRYLDTRAAIGHGRRLAEQGADLLDIGGESTRPGSQPVGVEEEVRRVLPVIEALAKSVSVPLSVDTTKAEVARRALEAGAHFVNDVTALRGDPAMAGVIASAGAGVILMHMQGTPATMQREPTYGDVVAEVAAFLEERLRFAEEAGIVPEQVAVDPGIGFGKTAEHNWELLRRLDVLADLGRPVCLGVSRKRFLGALTGREVHERLAASLAVACHALCRGSAHILRVHDVAETRDAVAVLRVLGAEGDGTV